MEYLKFKIEQILVVWKKIANRQFYMFVRLLFILFNATLQDIIVSFNSLKFGVFHIK